MTTTANGKPSPELPVHVTVCQLEKDPKAYDRKLIEVYGRIYTSKFDFIIDAKCQPHSQAAVWLDIGGDVESPAKYWDIGNFFPKQPGVDVQVGGVTVPLVHDVLLDEFVNDVGATRFQKPNGDGCGAECLFYEVRATLRGRFFSGTKGGFGMEHCCHLLVVEKVVNLSSRRTSVPAGATYQCSSDRWLPTPDELQALSAIPACSLLENFKNCYPAIAKHWGETIKASDSLGDRGWMSPDMTASYKFAGGFISKPGQHTQMTPTSSFIHDVCRPLTPPLPPSDHIYCRFYRSRQPQGENEALEMQMRVDAGQESWRSSDMAQVAWSAYERARTQWHLPGAAQVKLSKCEAWPAGKDGEGNPEQWGYCMWVTPDDMQQITVQLYKPGHLAKLARPLEKVVWIANGVEVNICETKPLR